MTAAARRFFFTNLDWTRFRSGVLPGFGNTTPIDAFKQGDFGALLTGNQVGVDALGRPVMGGQIFDPQTTRLVNGVPVRDPFPNNQIPANHPLRSQVASRIVPLMVRPDRAGFTNNVAGNPAGDQTWELDARNMMFRVGPRLHARTSAPATASTGIAVRQSATAARSAAARRNSTANSSRRRTPTTTAPGSISASRPTTRISSSTGSSRSNLLNHTTIAYDRWFMGGNSLSAGAGWPQRLWGANQGGLINTTGGPPVMTFGGNIPYTAIGQNWPRFGFLVNNRWQFSNDLTWVKGRHTLKTGFEYRHHNFPFRGWGQAETGQFNFNRLGTGGYDASGNSLAGDRRPVRVVPPGAGAGRPTQTIPVYPDVQRGLHRRRGSTTSSR